MNKELLLEQKNLEERDHEIHMELCKLRDFFLVCQRYEKYFQKKEQLKALKKIRNYFQIQTENSKLIHKNLREIKENIAKTCLHEILIKDGFGYKCCICNKEINNQNLNNCIIVECDGIIFSLESVIKIIIYEMLENNESIVDTFENHIEDENIRVYRR